MINQTHSTNARTTRSKPNTFLGTNSWLRSSTRELTSVLSLIFICGLSFVHAPAVTYSMEVRTERLRLSLERRGPQYMFPPETKENPEIAPTGLAEAKR